MRLLKLVPDNTNIDFMRWRNVALILSIARRPRQPRAGRRARAQPGHRLRRRAGGPHDLRQAGRHRAIARPHRQRSGVGDASIQAFGDDRTYQIRLPKPDGPDAAANQVVSKVRGLLAARISRRQGVGAAKACRARCRRSWPSDGALAILFAMIGIAIYIWFRFEWQFGVGALVTLFHDVSMTLGFFSLTQLQVDLNVVAAILADRRLFAQRHGRHLRPHPRKSAQVSQDGDRPVAQPVAQRDAVADDGDLAVDHVRARAC